MVLQYGLGSTVSGVALTHFLFLLATNFKVARWDRWLYMALSGVLPTLVVSFAFTYLLATSDAESSDALGGPYLISIFFIQIIPTIVGPTVQKPILGDIMQSPVKMGLLSVILTAAVALVVLDVLTPAYARGSTSARILIRVVVFPLLIEIPAGAVRVAAKYWLKPDFPLSRLVIFLLSPIVLSSMVGRFLTTNMETISDTVAVAVLLSAMEVLMRSTMLWRDDLYAACCGRPCGGRAGKKKHRRAEAHSWVVFMLFETMVEDVSILLSLPVTLLMRIPPLPGGEPLSTGDVIVRVLIQYVIETLTDVGFALGYYVMTACCGVRYNAVSLQAMELRYSNTLIRRDEQHRYLFVPLPLRKLARRISSMSASSPSRGSSPPPSRGLAVQTATTPDRPPRTPLHDVKPLSEDAQGSVNDLVELQRESVEKPFAADGPSKTHVGVSGIASPPAVERRMQQMFDSQEVNDPQRPPLGPNTSHSTVPHTPHGFDEVSSDAAGTSVSGSTPHTAVQVTSSSIASGILDDSPSHFAREADEASAAFCSCTPCCLPRNHPLARRTRQELKQELRQEVRWEREFLWQPMPIGLVAYQAHRSRVCLQQPFWSNTRSASTSPPAPTDTGAAPAVAATTAPLAHTGIDEQSDTADVHMPPPLVLDEAATSTLAHATQQAAPQEAAAAKAARLASDLSEASAPGGAKPVRLSSYDQAEAVRYASDGQPPSSTAVATALQGGTTLSSSHSGVSPVARPATHNSKTSDYKSMPSDVRYNTEEQALAFDQLIAQQNGTEVDASLDDGFEPSSAQVLTMRLEIVAVMFLRGWDTRFKNFNWMLFFGTFAGAMYVLRTLVGALCPFGDADDPGSWKFDYCTDA